MNHLKLNIDTSFAINPTFDLQTFLAAENFKPEDRREGWQKKYEEMDQFINPDWSAYMKELGLEFT